MKKLKVFVGSSSEAKDTDIVIRKILEEYNIQVIPWSEIFYPGDYGLESLLNISNDIDAALLIATSDDKTWYRGHELITPRDNILFELGFFIKSLGRTRAGIVLVKDKDGTFPKIPTDLYGINLIMYDSLKPAKTELEISNWTKHLQKHIISKNNIDDSFYLLRENYHKVPDAWKDEIHNYILTPFRQMSIDAIRGEFTLDSFQYYNSLIAELNKSDQNTVIRAISLLSLEIWEQDEQQLQYEEQNYTAIERGTIIKRIFICADQQIGDFWDIINQQMKNGIKVKTMSPKTFGSFRQLEDCTIIMNKDKIISYLTNQYSHYSSKLRGCRLNVNYNTCEELITVFEHAWNIAKEPIPRSKPKQPKTYTPPGLTMETQHLKKPVISCEEAAKEKGIPLENELKSLILITDSGFVTVHLPGNSVLSLREVKNMFNTSEACLADKEDLAKLGVTAGTVSAVLEPVWSLPHLISKRLLTLNYVSTNNGTKTGYFKFDPVLLMQSKNFILGEFERKD